MNATSEKQKAFIEETQTLYKERIQQTNKDEIERMYACMRKACLALEETDALLFRKAMIQPLNSYFPIDRRIPVDTLPVSK